MINLFDILQAQSGPGFQALGQPFGLTPEQSRRAVEALLPALSLGLQRNAANSAGFGQLFGFGAAVPPAAQTQPDLLLGHLFGSPALSQAILQQAAATSGIGAQALRQMLPLMAGMIVTGIAHLMLNPPPAASQPGPAETAGLPGADLWTAWMRNFTPTDKAPAAAKPAPQPARVAAQPSPSDTANAPGDLPARLVQQMFETGAQVHEQNAKAMQNLFETFWTRAPDATAATPGDANPPDTTGRARPGRTARTGRS